MTQRCWSSPCLEPAAFGMLYERHGLPVRRYVVRRVGIYEVEDLAAEVFVRAFRARSKYRADYQSALPWLLGVANHVISDHRRVERRRLATVERLLAAVPISRRHLMLVSPLRWCALCGVCPRPTATRCC